MPFTYEEKCFVKIHRTICISVNSPDLNPVELDYAVSLQQSMYRTRFSTWTISKTVCAPAVRILILDQEIIYKSIDHWRDKLKDVVLLNGGHIEQLF